MSYLFVYILQILGGRSLVICERGLNGRSAIRAVADW